MRCNFALACLLAVIMTVSIINEASSKSNLMLTENETISYSNNISKLSINVKSIDLTQSVSGNRKPINLGISVINLLDKNYICGLNASNFEVETLKVASYGAAMTIMDVFPITLASHNNSAICNYCVSIIPRTYKSQEYIWKTGAYAIKINYINKGQRLANTTVGFRI